MSPEKKKVTLAQALLKAQQAMINPKMTGRNPHFKSKFAPLDEVLLAVKKPLNDNGLVLLQMPVHSEGGVGIKTVLIHESGEQLDCGEFHIPVPQADPQKFVSAQTYAKRAAASSVFALAGEEDQDGNGLGDKPKSTPAPASNPIDVAYKKALTDAAKVLDKETCLNILEKCGDFKSSADVKLDKDKKNVTEQLRAAIALAGLGK